MKKNKTQIQNTIWLSWLRLRYLRTVIILIAVIVMAGCTDSYLRQEIDDTLLKDRLDKIDTVQLKEHSISAPVTIEKANERISNHIAEPNESKKTMSLNLDQVRAYALEKNLDLKVELVDPSIAQQTLKAEQAKFESVFSGSAYYQRAETVGTGAVSKTQDYQIGFSKPTQTGGSVQVDFPFGDGNSSLADAAASVSFIQSLLRGAGTRINTNSIRIAAHRWNVVGARTKLAAIYLLANADVAYWRLYSARKELDVRNEQYKLAQNQLNNAQKKVAAGSAPKIEIVRAEAGLASRLEAVINAETAVQSRTRDLQRIMNRDDIPLEKSVEILTLTEPNPLGLELDEKDLTEKAISNRMEMIELEQLLTIDDLNVELAGNDILPDLTFNYSYAGQTQGRSVGCALGHLTSGTFDDHYIGLSAVFPLGNEASKARLRSARLTKIQDLAVHYRLRQSIRQDVYDAVSELDNNWRRILAAEQGVIAAERDYKVEQSQFQLGRRTSTDVLFAVTHLADAQLSKIRALVDYEIAQINLARATGTLLGFGQISILPVDIE